MITATAVRRALISVWDKAGLLPFAAALHDLGVELISTAGTARALAEAGFPVTAVSDLTGYPELLGGRVKTLHPAIAAAILAGEGPHQEELRQHGIRPIDLVVVNLYPFAAAAPRVADESLAEWIDIGGVTLLRAAAKNWQRVGVICEPAQYSFVEGELRRSGTLAPETRRRLAARAFGHTAAYDAAIAARLGADEDSAGGQEHLFPESLMLAYRRAGRLRYGENPHQRGALYLDADPPAGEVVTAAQVQGRSLSYNNLVDLDAAWQLVREFPDPAAVLIKHATPCGAALGRDAAEAVARALASDPESAFGGIVALNRPLDDAAVQALDGIFLEALIAPALTSSARLRLAVRKNLRVLAAGTSAGGGGSLALIVRSLPGGLLVQEPDAAGEPHQARVVTARAPGAAEWADLRFACLVCKHARSNAIVLAAGGRTVGIGAGQTSRVESVRLAVARAGAAAPGSVMASDAFFPFPDGIEAAAAAGVRAVIQPGGSVRDAEVIAAADRAGLAMAFTGVRHFRH